MSLLDNQYSQYERTRIERARDTQLALLRQQEFQAAQYYNQALSGSNIKAVDLARQLGISNGPPYSSIVRSNFDLALDKFYAVAGKTIDQAGNEYDYNRDVFVVESNQQWLDKRVNEMRVKL